MRQRLWRTIRSAWVGAGLAFSAWMIWGFQALDVAGDAAESDDRVEVVTNDGGLHFRPLSNARRAGLIFLPGGMVEPVAYAPLLRKVAEAGYPARLVYLPMRCGCTDSQIAQVFRSLDAIVAGNPEIAWVLAGHSRGGMLASRHAQENAAGLAGLALIGTTHPRDFSLAGLSAPVMKIYGTRDGIASYDDMLRNKHLLPTATEWVALEGGNHVQFGYYRSQLGDNAAGISRAEQQQATERAVLSLLERIDRQPA